MPKYCTATLSHNDIRSALYRELSDRDRAMCMIDDVWDGYCVYTAWDDDDKARQYKQEFKISGDDSLELVGDPVEVEERYVKKGTMEVVASRVLTASAGQKLLADLKVKNEMIGAIADSANAHLMVIDLTTIGRPSQHQGDTKYVLEREGLEAAIATLVSKPVHVSSQWDAHVDAGKYTPIGTFLGAVPIENDDGTVTLRTVANLWRGDFPDAIEEIQANAKRLGASYEVAYDPLHASRDGQHVRIKSWQFSGGAILLKTAAAHPETQVFADALREEMRAETLTTKERNALKDSDFALIQRNGDSTVRRFPIHDEAHRKNAWARLSQAKEMSDSERSATADRIMGKAKAAGDKWAKAYAKSGGKWVIKKKTEGGGGMKYHGVPEEMEALVQTHVDAAVASARTADKAEIEKLSASLEASKGIEVKQKADLDALTADKTALTTKVSELTVKAEKLEGELATAKTELETIAAQKAEAEQKAKVEATWAKLKADYGLTDEQRAEREELLAKLAAGKEPVTVEEFQKLVAGGKGAASARPAQPDPSAAKPAVPLFAGAGDRNGKATPEQVQQAWPALAAMANKKGIYR